MKLLKGIYVLARLAGFAAGLATILWRELQKEPHDDHLPGDSGGARRGVDTGPGDHLGEGHERPGPDSELERAVGRGAVGTHPGEEPGGVERVVRVVDGRSESVSLPRPPISAIAPTESEFTYTKYARLSISAPTAPNGAPTSIEIMTTDTVVDKCAMVIERAEEDYMWKVRRRQARHMLAFRKAVAPFITPTGAYAEGVVEVATTFWQKRGIVGEFILLPGGMLCGHRLRVREDVS